MSFPDYMNKIRLERAWELLLAHPPMDVKDIHQRAGYNNSAYFASLFKQAYGELERSYEV
jgi:two-component system response regulator YesN